MTKYPDRKGKKRTCHDCGKEGTALDFFQHFIQGSDYLEKEAELHDRCLRCFDIFEGIEVDGQGDQKILF